jgi:electron transport complex protein RnfD
VKKDRHFGESCGNLSAIVTGLMLALVLPPACPPWMTCLGALFAIVVAKEFFGGLGANVFNPALAGRAFMMLSFGTALTTWYKPNGWKIPFIFNQSANLPDALTTATPLAAAKALSQAPNAVSSASLHFFTNAGAAAASQHGLSYGQYVWNLFWGNYGGCIGETSSLLILAGCIYLLLTKTIDWKTPVAMVVSAFFFAFCFGLDPLTSILSGGLLFGAVFMATDYVTTPVTGWGQVIFGIGCGLITMLIRRFGSYPEGVMFSILIMNRATPFLDKLRHRKYGYVKPVKGGKK